MIPNPPSIPKLLGPVQENIEPREDESNCAYAPGHDTQMMRLEARTERAETRTEQAKIRTEQAEIRTEQAESRTEQAKTRTEQAELRSERAEIRTEQAEMRSEEAIRLSELRYRRLFEAAKDGIVILDAETGRISEVNPFLTELLGFSRSEMIGKTIWELSPSKAAESGKKMIERLRSEGHVRNDDLPLETRDGRAISVEFVGSAFHSGESHVIQCNVRDISRRKRAEEQLRILNLELEQRVAERTQELQTANQDLEAFSYSVSHDLRTPLRHISGFVKLLQKDAGPALSEKNLHQLATIVKAGERMRTLIDDLLAFSRIGKSELRKAEVNLNALVREAMSDVQVDTKERNIAWEIQALPIVRGDNSLLRLALVNLISNAIKFTRNRDQARIEIGCLPCNHEETVLFIRDNGTGFDPLFAGKLFGVFQRLHSQREFEGTGVGLANVQRIIQRHGGRVWAEGVVDGGATFYFSIPKEPNK